ncbi:MAG: hypothetical protein Q9159_002937 [Coniocarpon cinnabarinum]
MDSRHRPHISGSVKRFPVRVKDQGPNPNITGSMNEWSWAHFDYNFGSAEAFEKAIRKVYEESEKCRNQQPQFVWVEQEYWDWHKQRDKNPEEFNQYGHYGLRKAVFRLYFGRNLDAVREGSSECLVYEVQPVHNEEQFHVIDVDVASQNSSESSDDGEN